MPLAVSARAGYEIARSGVRTASAPHETAVLTRPAEIAALAGEWRDLERRSGQPAFFQAPTWSMLACRAMDGIGGRRFQPCVVTVRRGRELVAVAPLRIAKAGPLHLATDLGDPFGQYGGMLIADDANAEVVVGEVCAALEDRGDVDGLCLRRVRADSPAHAPLVRRGFVASGREAAPYIDLRPHADFRAFQQTVNAKTRKNLRNLRNRLGRIAPVTHRVADGGDLDGVIAQSCAGRLRWLDEHGIPSMAFGHPAFPDLLAGLRRLAQQGDLTVLAMGLYCGDVAVSLQWGFVHRGRYYAYIAARDPAFDACSPGRLHLEDVIRTCFERDIAICDFLAPSVPYKLTWTDRATEVVDIAVPFSFGARLWLDAWNRRLRPAIKSRYAQLPVWLRRRIRQVAA
jgi:CelD/BcsL family acetyltransferase involved in cellulose biosynthesis